MERTVWEKWADVLISYSLEVQEGQKLIIVGDPESMPLIDACYVAGLQRGAFVEFLAMPHHHQELFFKHGHHFEKTHDLWKFAVDYADAYLSIKGASNTRALSHYPEEKHQLVTQAYKPILNTVMTKAAQGKMRWCTTQFPSASLAQEANMGSIDYFDLAMRAAFLDQADPVSAWKKLKAEQGALVEKLTSGKVLRFINDEGTDLEVDVSGMQWMNFAGRSNFPDGEVFTGPNLRASNGGVNGTVRVTFPTIWKQVEVTGIQLQFEGGAVVSSNAETNGSFLKAMIGQDEGARFVGEVALGTNYGIDIGTKNILFDEKIGGTFHIALGRGYAETGNTNESALHWDLVTDLRKSGKIFLDDELILEKGRFLDPRFPK